MRAVLVHAGIDLGTISDARAMNRASDAGMRI